MGNKRADRAEPGIFKKGKTATDPDVKVLDYSYTGDALPSVVAAAWLDTPVGFYADLMSKNPVKVKDCLKAHGVYLKKPCVLTEAEYEAGWLADDDEVVLVLPDKKRTDFSAGANLLETAKALMACTPHGI